VHSLENQGFSVRQYAHWGKQNLPEISHRNGYIDF
jgi:hypothetical protein